MAFCCITKGLLCQPFVSAEQVIGGRGGINPTQGRGFSRSSHAHLPSRYPPSLSPWHFLTQTPSSQESVHLAIFRTQQHPISMREHVPIDLPILQSRSHHCAFFGAAVNLLLLSLMGLSCSAPFLSLPEWEVSSLRLEPCLLVHCYSLVLRKGPCNTVWFN